MAVKKVARKKKNTITVQFGSNGEKVFNSIAEVISFHADEWSHWTWVQQTLQRKHQFLMQTWSTISREWTNLWNKQISTIQNSITSQSIRIEDLRKDNSDGKNDQLIEQTTNDLNNHTTSVINVIEGFYRKYDLPFHNSQKFKFLENLRSSSDDEAAAALIYFLNKTSPVDQNPVIIKGIFEAILFEKNLSDQTQPTREAFYELESELRDQINETIELKDQHEQILTELHDSYNSQFINLINNSDSTLTKKEDEFKEAIDVGKTKLTNIGKAYNEFMKLQAPVEYWKANQSEHKDGAELNFFWFFLFGLTGIIGLIIFSQTMPAATAITKITLGQTGLYIIPLFLFFWTMRIIARNYLSHKHLAIDAGERIVMVKTYLAMLREGNADTTKEEKELMLQMIFRPTQIGIIKDDGAPPNSYELISRLISKIK